TAGAFHILFVRAARPALVGLVPQPGGLPSRGRSDSRLDRRIDVMRLGPGQALLRADAAAMREAIGRAAATAGVILARIRMAGVFYAQHWKRKAGRGHEVGEKCDPAADPAWRRWPELKPADRAHDGQRCVTTLRLQTDILLIRFLEAIPDAA